MTYMDHRLADKIRAYVDMLSNEPRHAIMPAETVARVLATILDGTYDPRADLPPAEPAAPPEPCPEGFHWIGQALAFCDKCGLPGWEHAGTAEPSLFDSGAWVLRPLAVGEREAVAHKWEPSLLDRGANEPAPADRCDPVRQRHVNPHRGCTLHLT